MANQEFIAQIFRAWPDEAKARMDKATFHNNGVPPSDDQLEDIALAIVGANSPTLYELQQIRDANAVDLTQLPPAYRAQLESTGATQADIVAAAQKFYPNLDRAAALQKWTAAASQVDYDISYGPGIQYYDPARGSRPTESNG